MDSETDRRLGHEKFTVIKPEEDGQSCLELGFLHYCMPFIGCRCELGCRRCSEEFRTAGTSCSGEDCCSPAMRLRCLTLCGFMNFRALFDAFKTAWRRWPAFAICLLISCIFFIGYLAFNRVPIQGDDEALIRSINSIVMWAGILIVIVSVTMSCGCYFILHEVTSTFSHTTSEESITNIHDKGSNDGTDSLFAEDNATF